MGHTAHGRHGRLRLRALIAIGIVAGVVALSAAAPASAQSASSCPAADSRVDQLQPWILNFVTVCLINQERAQLGVKPLRYNVYLAFAATRHAEDMVANHFFEHVSPQNGDLVDRIERTKYAHDDWTNLGEDIGWGGGDLATPASMVQAWMNSPEHRRNILDPKFKDLGVGITPGAPVDGVDTGATYVADFAARQASTVALRRTARSASCKKVSSDGRSISCQHTKGAQHAAAGVTPGASPAVQLPRSLTQLLG